MTLTLTQLTLTLTLTNRNPDPADPNPDLDPDPDPKAALGASSQNHPAASGAPEEASPDRQSSGSVLGAPGYTGS